MPDEKELEMSRVDLVTSDGVLFIGRCILHAALLSGDGANADAQVFDSQSGNDGEKFHLEALSGTTFGWQSTDGIPFHKGIYIKVNAATAHLMIEWHPVHPASGPRGHKEG